jgi:hypothetical protein
MKLRTMPCTSLIPADAHLDLLFEAALLCEVCQLQPWTQHAQYCGALICADCAEGELGPED